MTARVKKDKVGSSSSDDDGQGDDARSVVRNERGTGTDRPLKDDAAGADGQSGNQDGDHGGSKNGMRRKRKLILFLLAGAFILAGLVWLLLWIFVYSQRETTDDAYVHGNQVTVSSQLVGTVVEVRADDTQRVRAGDVLVRLDPTDAKVNLARAKSELAQAVRQVRQRQDNADAADAQVASDRLRLQQTLDDLARRVPLLDEDAIAPEELGHARDAVATARIALHAAERRAQAARAAVDGTSISANPAVMQKRAQFLEAWIAKGRNAIVAPISGYVAQRSVQVGQRVQPGQALLTVIPLNDLWVEANFKEGQLAHVRIGQPVDIETDIYGGDFTYSGRVMGLGAGTGSAFALLPPENASGNWIKVVQRVPVRIALLPRELETHPLRLGLSTTVTVDTHDRSGDVLAQAGGNPAISDTAVYQNDQAAADAAAEAVIRANLDAAAAR